MTLVFEFLDTGLHPNDANLEFTSTGVRWTITGNLEKAILAYAGKDD